ncbi:MAG TPA: hypothetical protein VK616_13820, partial [Flavitalea sp.]|nr:hypothetical protein [Flavitalea sp.]
MNKLVILIPLMPLAGFLINGLFRKSLPKVVSGIIGSGAILISFILSIIVFAEINKGNNQVVSLFEFIKVGKFSIPFSFLVDPLSSIFLLIITGVGFLIHLYSTAYMREENNAQFARYFA